VLAFANGLPTFLAAEFFGFWSARFSQLLLRACDAIRVFVAQHCDLHAVDAAQSRNGARTAVPQPDDTDAHDVQFRRGVSTHVKCLLAISTLYAVGETFFGFTSEGK